MPSTNHRRSHLARLILAAGLACAGATPSVQAQSTTEASTQASALSVLAIDGSIDATRRASQQAMASLHDGAQLVVQSVRLVGRGLVLGVKVVGTGAVLLITLPVATGLAATVAAGTLVSVAIEAGGMTLRVAGELLGFLPAAEALDLLHRRELGL